MNPMKPMRATKKGSSYGHWVQALDEREAEAIRQHPATLLFLSKGCNLAYRCGRPITHRVGYHYINGRESGRAYAQRWCCEVHAAKYAQKHGLICPPVDRTIGWGSRTLGGVED